MATFEQEANQFLVDLKNENTIIEGNLIGVREDIRTAKAIISIIVNDVLEEKHIAIYEIGEELNWSYLKPIDIIESMYDFLDDESWHYPDLLKRIVAPIELANEYPQIKVWFDLRKLPVVVVEDTVYLYCNYIEPNHQSLVDGLEFVTVEDKPTDD